MRRSRARVLATVVLSLTLVACSAPGPAATTQRSSTPTAQVATPSPAVSAGAAIDLTTLSGRIVFDDSQDVWAINPDGSGLERLTDEPWREFDPALSPDGRLIAYRSEPEEYPQLWIMNADGTEKRQLTPEGGFPAWSPDGSLLAYAPPGGPSGRSSIAIMNPDGSDDHPLPGTERGEYPSWSPDAKRIAFTSAHTGTRFIYVVDVNGYEITDLSSAGGGTHPAWSPDGSSILFASDRDHSDNYRDLYVMRPDGSGVTRLTFASAESPAWSPDGRYIVFSAPGGLGFMHPDGSGLASLPIPGVSWASSPDWR